MGSTVGVLSPTCTNLSTRLQPPALFGEQASGGQPKRQQQQLKECRVTFITTQARASAKILHAPSTALPRIVYCQHLNSTRLVVTFSTLSLFNPPLFLFNYATRLSRLNCSQSPNAHGPLVHSVLFRVPRRRFRDLALALLVTSPRPLEFQRQRVLCF